jgi:hypothetical protein
MTTLAKIVTEEELPLRCFPLRRTSVKPLGFERSPNHRPAITGKSLLDARPLPCVAYTVPDGIEPANCEVSAHSAPRLALEPAVEPSPIMATVNAYHAYLAVSRAMANDPRATAITTKQETLALSDDGRLAQEASNAPSFMPLSEVATSIDRVKRVMVELDGRMVRVPVHVPVGHAHVAHWHNRTWGIASPAIHAPEPVTVTSEPVRVRFVPSKGKPSWRTYDPCETETQTFAWLAGPWFGVERTVTKRKRSNRLDALMAKFWEHGDGKAGLQPVDPRNAELRAMPKAIAA